MSGTTADLILQLLARAGVKSIYGVSGDAIFPLLDAVARQEKIRFYSCAMESGAAFMACYEARITGNLAVCTATSGPGTLNLLNGLAEAYFDRLPVLAVTGQVETSKIGTRAKQFVKQDILFSSVSSFSQALVHPDAAVPLLLEAIQTAVNQRTVSHISVPMDVFQMPVNPPATVVISGSPVVFGSGISNQIQQASQSIGASKKLLIIVGCRGSQIANAAEALAEKRNAGIITAQQAKGVLPDWHPRVVGGIGEGYQPSLVEKADCILLVGQAPYELKYLPAQVPLIQLAESPHELHFSRISCGLTGSPRELLRLLTERLEAAGDSQPWLEEINAEKERRSKMLAQDALLESSPIHPARLISALNRVVPEDAIIALDIGSFVHWFDRGFQAERQMILISANWRSMGSSLPAAIAAAVAQPDRKAVAVTGDGGFLMSMAELTTAVHYKLPVTVIVFSNGRYNLEEQKMIQKGLLSFGNDICTPDFAKFAQSCGAMGITIEQPDQVEDVLSAALNSAQPTVVNVKVSNDPLPSLR